jgi:hypothetical protein
MTKTLQSNKYFDIIQKFEIRSDLFAYARGKPLYGWIDAGSRSNGYSDGDLNEQPAYIIEDILREEIHTERDLKTDSTGDWATSTKSYFECAELLSSQDDFYNGAYVTLIGPGYVTRSLIEDYDGANKHIYLADLLGSLGTGDNFYITNINCNIDETSFDAVGNTTNGTRDNWIFSRSITARQTARQILGDLLFESQLILVKSGGEYKLFPNDSGSSSGTLSKPLISGGVPMIRCYLSPVQDLFSHFVLNYAVDPATGQATKRLFCNKLDSSSALGSSYETKCANVESNYRTVNKFEYEAKFIYDETTAGELLKLLVNWYTFRHLNIDYSGDIENHIQYEPGSTVLVNYSNMIPTGLNNSASFIILNKEIITNKRQGYVKLNLTQRA